MVAQASSIGMINPCMVETLTIPISKVDNPGNLKDFCPISLCNVLLKVISKVIVLRIRPHINDKPYLIVLIGSQLLSHFVFYIFYFILLLELMGMCKYEQLSKEIDKVIKEPKVKRKREF